MESIQYAAKMERKLVDDFKKLFQEKLGYLPIVFTKTDRDAAEIPFMSLEELNKHFITFLPLKLGEPLPLQTKRRAREIEEVEEEKPKKKREVTEAMKEHLATIRVKALKVKQEKKELREKAKQLENAELQLKADKYDKAIEEKAKLKTPPKKEEVVEEVVEEEVKPKKVKKVIKKVVEESESEEEVQEVIIKKKSNNNKLTNNEKVQLAEQSAEERLRQSLKEDRLNYLLNQIGAKL